jgi:ribose-phosphate pyrophosphokinase
MVDDIVDSGGTLCNAAVALKQHGASEVHAYVVHGVLSGKASERIAGSSLESLVITDSIGASDAVKSCKQIKELAVAPLLAEAIRRISEERSISALFK